jgi:creatinine amidohydrolase
MLPGLPYGVDTNQMEFPLAMNVHQSTLNTIVGDLIDSLEKHRIPKLVILNGHGGNEFKSFLREIYGETEVFVSLVNWWQMALDHRKSIFVAKGDHADELETSVALALFGELVEMKNASDGTIHQTNIEAINEGWAQITRPWHLATNDSTMGDPRAATAEKGEAYLKIIEERLTDYLVQLAAEPMSEHFPYP